MGPSTRSPSADDALVESRDRRGVRRGLGQACTAILVASAVLFVAELTCLADAELVAAPARFGALFVQLVSLMALAELAAAMTWQLARQLAPARAAATHTLIMAGPLTLAVVSLFSGNAARELPGVLLIKGLVVLAGLAVVRLVIEAFVRLESGRWRAVSLQAALLAAGVCWASLWLDTHVQVGQYPAFHFVLGASALASAAFCARALMQWRVSPWRRPLASACALSALVALGITWSAWSAPPMIAVAAYSDGLAPKLREIVVAATGPRVPAVAHAASVDGRRAGHTASLGEGLNLLADLHADSADRWEWLGAEGALTAHGDDGPGLARRVTRVTVPRGGRGLLQTVERGGHQGEWFASVWIRALDGARQDEHPELRLTLSTGAELEVRGEAQVPSDRWTRLTVGPVELPVAEPSRGWRLPVDAAVPDGGQSWHVTLPADWRPLASDSDDPERSRVVLLEDGAPLGPANASHSRIDTQGEGRFSHWGNLLYFSSSDGSDPRHNGRTYELVRPDDAPLPTVDDSVRVSLLAETSDRAAEWLVSGVHLEHAPRRESAAPTDLHGLGADGDLLAEFAFTPTSSPAADRVRAATRNVIVVLMDAFRDDHVGKLVDGESITPNLDTLIDESVRFTTTYSASDHTGRSVPCLMTSLPLAVTYGASDNAVPLTTWLSMLAFGGYRTFHVGSNYVFRKYTHILLPPVYGAEAHGTLDSKAEGLEQELLDFVSADDDRPFAAFAHWSDAHVGRQKDMPAVYAEGVRKADARLGVLIDGLKARGLWDETMLVVTSDHGYGLGEDRRYLAGLGCDEQSLRVPFVVRLPGGVPARVPTPVSGHDVAGTVLDVMLPEARTAVWSSGVLGLALDPSRPRSRPVNASTGAIRMLRQGEHKLVENRSRDTRLVFDMGRDPEERDPAYDGARLDALLVELAEQTGREQRLVRALVGRVQQELPEYVLTRLIDDELELDAVREVLGDFWRLDSNVRQFVLRTLYQRGFEAVRFDLEQPARDGWTDDDQRLLVMRVWAGSRPAARELLERYDALSPAGLAWLLELLPDLPTQAVEPLVPRMVAEVERLDAREPVLGGEAERRLALMAYGLAWHLREDAPRSVRRALVERFNAWARENPSPYFATLRTRKFVRRNFLTALRRCMVDEDLDLLEDIVHNRDVAIVVPEICLRLDSERSKEVLLGLIGRWQVPSDTRGGALSYMLPTLRKFDDEAFKLEANRIIQANYPLVWTLR